MKENVDIVEEVKRPNSATPLDVDTDDMADAEDEGTKYTLLNKQVLRLELGSVTSAMLGNFAWPTNRRTDRVIIGKLHFQQIRLHCKK